MRTRLQGLLTYHDGRKRWYHCTQCKYFNDRLYHSKMHYQVWVEHGESLVAGGGRRAAGGGWRAASGVRRVAGSGYSV